MTFKLRPCNIFVLLMFGFLAGCQTLGNTTANNTADNSSSLEVSHASYTIFSDQGDHLIELIESGNFQDAATLYEEQKEFFDDRKEKYQEPLSTVAQTLNGMKLPGIVKLSKEIESIEWPAPVTEWPTIKNKMTEAHNDLKSYASVALLNNPEYSSEKTRNLHRSLLELENSIHQSTESAFLNFDHFNNNFFEQYPVSLISSDILDQYFTSFIANLNNKKSQDILALSHNYSSEFLGQSRWKKLSNQYVEKRLQEDSDSSSLPTMLAVLKDAEDSGFKPDQFGGFKFGFLEVTSRTLLDEGQIEFPAQVDIDLPVEVFKAELDTALSSPLAGTSEYLIIFDVAVAKTHRRVTSARKRASKTLIGYKSAPNPEYNMAQNQVNLAQMDLQTANMNIMSANAQYCYGLGCLAKAISQGTAAAAAGEAQDTLASAMQRLNSTEMEIEKPVYANYDWDLTKVKSSKILTAHYYVIDRKKKSYFKSTFDVVEQEEFEVAYNVQNEDPDRNKIIQKEHTEQDVVEWEEASSTIPLSQLIDHYLANVGKSKKLPSMTMLRKEMLSDRNTALAAYKAETFTASTQNDPRFDSVVVVLMPNGSLGSGFYVTPDIVMTNYHVVDEGDFAELRLYDGQETFGKVIARDLRVDLALIKVQARGKPVKFVDVNTVDLGETVEVIGHPKGYMFSITRGVISAIRKLDTANISTKKDVLHVQIDAPTSPGNSGGPVFLDDRVVSVVSWGQNGQGAENLNFTIHYSEARRFLKENLTPNS